MNPNCGRDWPPTFSFESLHESGSCSCGLDCLAVDVERKQANWHTHPRRGRPAVIEWLTAAEAAHHLKVKPRTLPLWVRQGKVKSPGGLAHTIGTVGTVGTAIRQLILAKWRIMANR